MVVFLIGLDTKRSARPTSFSVNIKLKIPPSPQNPSQKGAPFPLHSEVSDSVSLAL